MRVLIVLLLCALVDSHCEEIHNVGTARECLAASFSNAWCEWPSYAIPTQVNHPKTLCAKKQFATDFCNARGGKLVANGIDEIALCGITIVTVLTFTTLMVGFLLYKSCEEHDSERFWRLYS